MKTKFVFVFLFFCTLLFGQEFFLKTTKDITLMKYLKPIGTIPANTVLNVEDFGGSSLYLIYNGESVFTRDLTSIIPLETKDLFDTKIVSNLFDYTIKVWIDIRYYEPLLQNNRKILLEYFPYLNTREYQWANEVNGYVPEWYEQSLTISHDYIWGIYNCLISDLGGYWQFPVKNIENNNNIYIVSSVKLHILNNSRTKINYDWSKIPNKEIFNLILMIDGDYMDIYIENTDIHFATLVHVSKNSVEQLDKLIQTNICDLSNITRPRRADKTHSVGATCVVAESLRLRKEENTSSATIQIMQPGTQVQIQQLGKKETIDGISANWVQVQLADGNIGWCFGGWLVEK